MLLRRFLLTIALGIITSTATAAMITPGQVSRYLLADSFRAFPATGLDSCDRILTLGDAFSAELPHMATLDTCWEAIGSRKAALSETGDQGDAALLESAVLESWTGLLAYWIGKLDPKDPRGNYFLAVRRFVAASEQFLSTGEHIGHYIRANVVGRTLYAMSNLYLEEEKYTEALGNLVRSCEFLGRENEKIGDAERATHHAHCLYWLGILRHQESLKNGSMGASPNELPTYELMELAAYLTGDKVQRSAYLLDLATRFPYLDASVSEPLYRQLEESARDAGSTELALWAALQHAAINAVQIKASNDKFAKASATTVDRVIDAAHAAGLFHIEAEAVNLRVANLLRFDRHEEALAYSEKYMGPISEHVQGLYEAGSPDLQYWGFRYGRLVDNTGRAAVIAGDFDQALAFYTSLQESGWTSIAINRAALLILADRPDEALAALATIEPDQVGDFTSAYLRNTVLAQHLSGDTNAAIQTLQGLEDPADVNVSLLVSLLAKEGRRDEAIKLISEQASWGWATLSQALLATLLSLYDDGGGEGRIINLPQPLFSFLDDPVMLSSQLEESGLPQYVSATAASSEQQATLVAGMGGDDVFSYLGISHDGERSALSVGNVITLWDNRQGLPFRRITARDDVKDLEFLTTGELLVRTSEELTLWNIERGSMLYSLPTTLSFTAELTLDPDTDRVIYRTPYSDLVAINARTGDKIVELTALQQGGLLAWDYGNDILYSQLTAYDDNYNPTYSMLAFDLQSRETILETPVAGNHFVDMWHIASTNQLLLVRESGQATDNAIALELVLWDIEGGFSESRVMPLPGRVSLLAEIESTGELLLRSYDETLVLDLDRFTLEALETPTEQKMVALSRDNGTAIMVNNARRALIPVAFPALQPRSQIQQLQLNPGVALYDEQSKRLVAESNFSDLHIWDFNAGSETFKKSDYPAHKPLMVENRVMAIVEETGTSYREETTLLSFSAGGAEESPLPIPQAIYDTSRAFRMLRVESEDYVYFVAPGDDRDPVKRTWRTDKDFSSLEELAWELGDEELVAVMERAGRIITYGFGILYVRDSATLSVTAQMKFEDDAGNLDALRVLWVDPEENTIWLARDNRLEAYGLDGKEKLVIPRQVGKFSGLGAHPGSEVVVIAHEMAGSTLLTVADRVTGETRSTHLLRDRTIDTMSLSTQGNYLVATTREGGILFWSMDSHSTLFTLYLLPDDNWLVVDEKGRFDTSDPGNLGFLAWRLPQEPMTPYSVDVFLKNFYEPRLIPRLLGDAPFAAVPDLSNINRWQPDIAIESIEPGSPGNVDITVKVERPASTAAQADDVYDLRLFRNGQQVAAHPEDHSRVSIRGDSTRVEFSDVALPSIQPGQPIEFTAYAFNSDGVKSRTAARTYVQGPDPVKRGARAFVINVGVDDYSDESWNLAFAGNDARLLSSTLVEGLEASYAFDEVISRELVSSAGNRITREDVKRSLTALTPQGAEAGSPGVTPDDTVFMTWSGHGYVDDDGEFYLLTSEVGQDRTDMGAVLEKAVSASALSRWIERIDAGRFVLVIDACHSAAAVDAGEFKPGPMGSRGFGQLAWYKGMQVLTASQANDVALESDLLQHGLLTYSLVKDGLQGSRADKLPADGSITTREWLRYGRERVPEIYSALLNGDASIILTGRGAMLEEDEVETVTQLPALFDFYRGDREQTLQ